MTARDVTTKTSPADDEGDDDDAAPVGEADGADGRALGDELGEGSRPKRTPGPCADGGNLSTQPGLRMFGFSSRPPSGCSRPLFILKISMNRLPVPSVCWEISMRVPGPSPWRGTT